MGDCRKTQEEVHAKKLLSQQLNEQRRKDLLVICNISALFLHFLENSEESEEKEAKRLIVYSKLSVFFAISVCLQTTPLREKIPENTIRGRSLRDEKSGNSYFK
jgi:hypothetical protein